MIDRKKQSRIQQSLPAGRGTVCPFTFKANLLSSLSNEVRLALLAIISQQETSVGALAARLNRSQSAVSQHLAKLRVAGFVDARRDRQTMFYSCNNPGAQKLLRDLGEIFNFESTIDLERTGS